MRTMTRNCFDMQRTTLHQCYSATKPQADFILCRNSQLFQRRNHISQTMHSDINTDEFNMTLNATELCHMILIAV